MKRQLLAEEWARASAHMPADFPFVQRREMRRAFYAGAQAFCRIITSPEHEAVAASLVNELANFRTAVNAGRA